MKKNMVKRFLIGAVTCVILGSLVGCGNEAKKELSYPTKDINMIVPFAAGGSTDLTGRAIADGMGKYLKTNIVVTNIPGASGSVGTLNVYSAKKDGYTILTDGMVSFTSMPVMGLSKTTHKDWDIWMATFTPNIIAVGKNSKYSNFKELLDDMKNNPGVITAGTAGQGSGGHIGMEVIKTATNIEYKHVPYQGGNPAIIAALSGEVNFAPQLLVEMSDMLRAGELKGLACLNDTDIILSNGPTIPTILKDYPEIAKYLPMGESTAIAVPKGLPEEVLKKIDEAFNYAVNNPEFKKFCEEKGFIVTAMGREESAEYVDRLASIVSWTLYDAGIAKKSPEEFGIARAQ